MINQIPWWATIPFVGYLLLIATLPLLLPAFWEHNRNKLALGVLAGIPAVVFVLHHHEQGAHLLLESLRDYVSFMALLGALFVISGGIRLRGALAGTPRVNGTLLGIGALLANVIGTTGASALLIRPLLRANERRPYARHLFVFFIFVVSNGGGLLTPLGDPPLFLGFLRGVPFTWTLRLFAPWLLVNGVLIALCVLIDVHHARKERATTPIHGRTDGGEGRLRIDGAANLLWLAGVVLVVFLAGTYGARWMPDATRRSLVQTGALVALSGLSFLTTSRGVHKSNLFSWAPIVEVAVVFLGIFVTMVPALSFLEHHGASLGVAKPWHFFWMSGALSSVLDNAPTYLTFTSLATAVVDGGRGVLSSTDLRGLASDGVGARLLAAVSCGSVLMGAVTYIGNGPNFMVKAIAEQHRVTMPSFFGYTAWSFAILVPLFGVVSLIFF